MKKWRDVCRNIIRAQVASDGGKGIDKTMDICPSVWRKGYEVKDKYIMCAIEKIEKYGIECTGWWYGFQKDYPYNIVYFGTYMYGKYYQISFHTLMFKETKVKMQWDWGDSRYNCLELNAIEKYGR